jgi:hypothetical protein
MARDPHAYTAYYPLSFWSGAIPGGPVLMIVCYLGSGSGPFRERLIATAIIVGGVLLLFWACAAKFGRIVALRVNPAGITVRTRQREKKTTVTLPWNDIEYLVIWHHGKTTSLSVQPCGGTAQPMRMPRLMPEPKNYVTIKAEALDEQRLLSAMTRYGPAVQIVDGNTGTPATGSPDEHRTRHISDEAGPRNSPRCGGTT